MNDDNRCRRFYCFAVVATAAFVALATPSAQADTFGVQLAGARSAKHNVNKLDFGFVWDPGLNWWEIGGWHFSLVGEAHVGYWHARAGVSRRDIVEFGVSPMLRFIKSSGAVRPYIEAGAGLRGLSHARVNDNYTLSTGFQFTETVGVGAQFGSHQQYQAGLRFQHISNASIKRPNPGINFSQLYLQYNF